MEPLTQATLGAAAAIAFTRNTPLKQAFWIGALGGFLPDADVLVRSSSDPLLHLEYHRQFTHSLAFIPVGGAITAGIGSLMTKGAVRLGDLWVPASIGWATHGLLDAFTSYGTQLLWPLSSTRIAWNTIAVVDPLYTLPLFILCILSLIRKNRTLSRVGLLWSAVYLLLGVHQRQKALDTYQHVVEMRDHDTATLWVKPSFGNDILFRAFYVHANRIYTDSVRVPWIGEPKVYEGSSIDQLDYDSLHASLGSTHQNDLERFHRFSNGFLVMDPIHTGVIGDVRYAMVPNTVEPIWGIDFTGRLPGKHMSFVRHTKLTKSQRKEFYRQLSGE